MWKRLLQKMNEFNVGDFVTLKTGSPLMMIIRISQMFTDCDLIYWCHRVEKAYGVPLISIKKASEDFELQ